MIEIRELKVASDDYLNDIAELHIRAFPHFFLTQLGVRFLRLLYSGYLEDSNSGIIVAEEQDCLVGFIAYSLNYSQFFKDLLKHHLVKFAIYSVIAAIRHPQFIKRLLGALHKSKTVEKKERYIELASICVDPIIENQGVGSSLIAYLKNMVDFSTYAYINLETDAIDNDAVNSFYLNNGFQLKRQFTTSEGRVMNEYRFTPGDR